MKSKITSEIAFVVAFSTEKTKNCAYSSKLIPSDGFAGRISVNVSSTILDMLSCENTTSCSLIVDVTRPRSSALSIKLSPLTSYIWNDTVHQIINQLLFKTSAYSRLSFSSGVPLDENVDRQLINSENDIVPS